MLAVAVDLAISAMTVATGAAPFDVLVSLAVRDAWFVLFGLYLSVRRAYLDRLRERADQLERQRQLETAAAVREGTCPYRTGAGDVSDRSSSLDQVEDLAAKLRRIAASSHVLLLCSTGTESNNTTPPNPEHTTLILGRMSAMAAQNKSRYPAELRERAVRLVLAHRNEYG